MDDFTRLLLLCLTMLVGSFIAGMLPLSLRLSEEKMRAVSTFGIGLLTGTSLMVIIPEGIQAVYSVVIHTAIENSHTKREQDISLIKRENIHNHAKELQDSMHGKIGLTLLAGFILMFLVDAFNDGHVHNHSKHKSSNSLSSTSDHGNNIDTELQGLLVNDERNDVLEQENHHLKINTPILTITPEVRTHSRHSSFQSNFSESSNLSPRRLSMTYPPVDIEEEEKPLSPSPAISNGSSSFTLGLIIHAALDGVALGASIHAPTLSIIVFMAIMLHKAPAAFGLCAVLLRSNTSRLIIKRHLFMFSIAAPFAALITFVILHWAIRSSSDLGIEYYTGLGLLFSGGTFLYVAMHVMQDVMGHTVSNKWQTTYIVTGMITPVILSSLGHGH